MQADGNVVLYSDDQVLCATRMVSTIDSHGNGTVNFRNCPDVTFPACGVAQRLPDGADVTMLCWEKRAAVWLGDAGASNKWFYVLIDSTQDEFGFVDAWHADHQLRRRHASRR